MQNCGRLVRDGVSITLRLTITPATLASGSVLGERHTTCPKRTSERSMIAVICTHSPCGYSLPYRAQTSIKERWAYSTSPAVGPSPSYKNLPPHTMNTHSIIAQELSKRVSTTYGAVLIGNCVGLVYVLLHPATHFTHNSCILVSMVLSYIKLSDITVYILATHGYSSVWYVFIPAKTYPVLRLSYPTTDRLDLSCKLVGSSCFAAMLTSHSILETFNSVLNVHIW